MAGSEADPADLQDLIPEGIDANQTTAIREDKTKKTGIKHPHDEAEDAFYSVEEKK